MNTRLQRFKDAQDQRGSGFEAALSELQSGRKRGHWIWYIFPQLAGLGHSTMSQMYGIDGIDEAEAYLRDPVLRRRFLTGTLAVAEQLRQGQSLESLMNSPIDAAKIVSSLTLFEHVAKRVQEVDGLAECGSIVQVADEVLEVADKQRHPRCRFTLEHLRR